MLGETKPVQVFLSFQAFLGPEAVSAELEEADRKLNSLCHIQQSVFNRTVGGERFFVELACHWPGLDGLEQHFKATFHTTLGSAKD